MTVRVLLVDDSGVSRALMSRWIDESGAATVVAVAASGAEALAKLREHPVDVVVLDIEMPGGDGLTMLPTLLAVRPGVRVLMASALTEDGAVATLEALRRGASDAIAKPRAGWARRGDLDFPKDLVARLVALGNGAEATSGRGGAATPPPLTYARINASPPQAVVVGASTGGPAALFRLLSALPGDLPVPVLVAQHMPPLFTRVLARELDRVCALAVREARDGERLTPGTVLLGPGGADLRVAGDRIEIMTETGVHAHPSVDLLFASAVEAWGSRVAGVVLSGMARDGLEGARRIAAAGGTMLVQDCASSVVWGMPGAVARAGYANAVMPIDDVAPALAQLVSAAFA